MDRVPADTAKVGSEYDTTMGHLNNNEDDDDDNDGNSNIETNGFLGQNLDVMIDMAFEWNRRGATGMSNGEWAAAALAFSTAIEYILRYQQLRLMHSTTTTTSASSRLSWTLTVIPVAAPSWSSSESTAWCPFDRCLHLSSRRSPPFLPASDPSRATASDRSCLPIGIFVYNLALAHHCQGMARRDSGGRAHLHLAYHLYRHIGSLLSHSGLDSRRTKHDAHPDDGDPSTTSFLAQVLCLVTCNNLASLAFEALRYHEFQHWRHHLNQLMFVYRHDHRHGDRTDHPNSFCTVLLEKNLAGTMHFWTMASPAA